MRQVMTDVGPLRKTDKIVLVRKENIPSVTPEQVEEIGMITGRGVKEDPTVDILYYCKSQMAKRGCNLLDIQTNNDVVVYAGRPYNYIRK